MTIGLAEQRTAEILSASLRSWQALRCPYCGSGLEWSAGEPPAAFTTPLDITRFAVLACACHRYPVVAGIPILQHKDGLERVVRLIDEGDHGAALLAALGAFRITWARKSRWFQFRYMLGCKRLVSDDDLSFEDAVQITRRPKVFADYLFHRWANPSFLAALGPLMLLGTLRKGGPQAGSPAPDAKGDISSPAILDVACGAGHSSFVMRLLFPWLSVVSTDQDFVSLYLAKRYLAPDAAAFCIDAAVPSPFPAGSFDAVFCLDAFHYFQSKCLVRDDLRRIVNRDGLWILAHLHNALQANITPGTPLPPEHYLEMFSALDGRLLDESIILDDVVRKNVLDLREQAPMDDLKAAQSFTFIAGTGDLWTVHKGFAETVAQRRNSLALNPIYARRGDGSAEQVALRWPNDVIARECAAVARILPSPHRLPRHGIESLLKDDHGSRREELEELVRHFVLVPLPARYRRSASTSG